jgi:hypothetical protein
VPNHRYDVYRAVRRRTPRRWARSTRIWSDVGDVYLNPINQEMRLTPIASLVASSDNKLESRRARRSCWTMRWLSHACLPRELRSADCIRESLHHLLFERH